MAGDRTRLGLALAEKGWSEKFALLGMAEPPAV